MKLSKLLEELNKHPNKDIEVLVSIPVRNILVYRLKNNEEEYFITDDFTVQIDYDYEPILLVL